MDVYATGGKLDSKIVIDDGAEKSTGMASCRAGSELRKQADTKSSFLDIISIYNRDDVLNKP
ncbi:hypothetical protein [Massilia aquatica]|uniref:Uncharacterized protein n=1 Tax=Massilia aquatica TaxID=2609000 RepID=A0ABX0M3V5_9BURK|nr:hypothetical protein [Massilia aquatica]NHZ39760.1 hypothetical protein [Massilia aquatica]